MCVSLSVCSLCVCVYVCVCVCVCVCVYVCDIVLTGPSSSLRAEDWRWGCHLQPTDSHATYECATSHTCQAQLTNPHITHIHLSDYTQVNFVLPNHTSRMNALDPTHFMLSLQIHIPPIHLSDYTHVTFVLPNHNSHMNALHHTHVMFRRPNHT